jgi:hypothetical protein
MRTIYATMLLTLMLSFSGVISVNAQDFALLCNYGACAPDPNGNQVSAQVGANLQSYSSTTLHGGYVAHGVGMRNLGFGSIIITDVPIGATISKAYLFWAIIGPKSMKVTDPINPTITHVYNYAKGKFNGHAITGTLIGSSGNPCWGGDSIWGYRADVHSYITKGGNDNYFLSGFASGETDGHDPFVAWPGDPNRSRSLAPMVDGATLVILFNKTGYPNTTVKIYNGMATTIYTQLHQTIAGMNALGTPGFAYSTFIVADGQNDYDYPNSTLFFFDNIPAVWSGADPNGNGANYSAGNLWDTQTVKVNKLVKPPEADFWFSTYDSNGMGADCISWEAQVTAYSDGSVDSDGDGFPDSWELSGHDGVDMAALGASPVHKDLFVEADYMSIGNVNTNNLLPPKTQLDDIVNTFNQAPLSNPDGTTGIHIHIDTGGADATDPPGTPALAAYNLGGGGQIPIQTNLGTDTSVNCNSYDWTQFQALKDSHFSWMRLPIFHYMIFAYDLAPCMGAVSGISRNGSPDSTFIKGATDFIVSLGDWPDHGDPGPREGTFVHELGHNLGLRHGGNDHSNWKPNYLSVMNYSFQTSGVWRDGAAHYDYSRLLLPSLNENSLNEAIGLGPLTNQDAYATKWFCPDHSQKYVYATSWLDWNCDNSKETSVKADINWDNWPNQVHLYTVLGSQNNWASITFKGNGVIGSGAPLADLAAQALPDTIWVNELSFDQAPSAPDAPTK